MKYCPKCNSTKYLEEFHSNKARYDGLCNYCKLCKNEIKRQYKLKNKEKVFLQRKIYEQRPGVQKARYLKVKIKQAQNISYKLAGLLRGRISKAVRNNQKAGSAVSDLGCSVQHFKLHLELFFDEGMSWENYGLGKHKWTIDHIKPLSSFDLTNRQQFLEACHYTNLQPMWYLDNISKSDTL